MPLRDLTPAGLTAAASANHLRDIGPKPELADPCDLDLECPLTVELFVEPVISRDDGHTYDKAPFVKWVMTKDKPTSPLTRAPLTLAEAWKRRPSTAPNYFVPNHDMSKRVKAYREEAETFEVRLASWEEAKAQLEEDVALLTAIEASRAHMAASTAPSAPPWEAMRPAVAASHAWLQPDAAPFGRIDWPKSRQKQTADEYAKRSDAAYRVGDLPEALRWLGKAMARAPQDTPKLLRLVRMLTKEGRMAEALMWLQFGVRVKPQDMERNYEFGQLLLAQAGIVPAATLDDAGYFLQQALDLQRPLHDPVRPHSCMLLARLCAALGDYRFRAGQPEIAHSLFEEAERNHRGHGAYVQRLGRSWLHKAARLGITQLDTPELRKALALLDQARTMLKSECQDHRNRDGSATRALAACLHTFGEANLLAGDDKSAAEHFREAIALHRHDGAYHGSSGDALRNLGDTAAARSAYFKAAALDPGCGRYDYEVSCIAYGDRRLDLALNAAEEAARKAPQSALFASHLATLQAQSESARGGEARP